MEMKNNQITTICSLSNRLLWSLLCSSSKAYNFRTLPADFTLHVKQYNKCTTLKFTNVFYCKLLNTCNYRTSAAQRIWMIKYLAYRRLSRCWSYLWRNRWGRSRRSLCSPPRHCHCHSHLSIKHKIHLPAYL